MVCDCTSVMTCAHIFHVCSMHSQQYCNKDNIEKKLLQVMKIIIKTVLSTAIFIRSLKKKLGYVNS